MEVVELSCMLPASVSSWAADAGVCFVGATPSVACSETEAPSEATSFFSFAIWAAAQGLRALAFSCPCLATVTKDCCRKLTGRFAFSRPCLSTVTEDCCRELFGRCVSSCGSEKSDWVFASNRYSALISSAALRANCISKSVSALTRWVNLTITASTSSSTRRAASSASSESALSMAAYIFEKSTLSLPLAAWLSLAGWKTPMIFFAVFCATSMLFPNRSFITKSTVPCNPLSSSSTAMASSRTFLPLVTALHTFKMSAVSLALLTTVLVLLGSASPLDLESSYPFSTTAFSKLPSSSEPAPPAVLLAFLCASSTSC
mmetsp:Transcript_37555/g.116821  ORF Transcript_37555/g.116821 Transcript_37555/m.116821 type:complete len:317 (-) Transcript_37555:218-1168(-)